MDTAWIQVFVLTIAECVAPAGKTVCQEQQLEMLFLNENDCNVALEQLVSLKSKAENVIVDAEGSYCAPTARRKETFQSLDAVIQSVADRDDWRAPPIVERTPDFTQVSHQERLETMKTCEETDGVAPCRIGDIVIEAAASGQPVEIWQRER